MISGSRCGPNTMSASTTISTSSRGPIPRKFMAAGLCRADAPSVDLKALAGGQQLGREAVQVGGGDPHLAVRTGLADASYDVSTPGRVEFGEHIVKQQDRCLTELRLHPVGLGQLERQHG